MQQHDKDKKMKMLRKKPLFPELKDIFKIYDWLNEQKNLPEKIKISYKIKNGKNVFYVHINNCIFAGSNANQVISCIMPTLNLGSR